MYVSKLKMLKGEIYFTLLKDCVFLCEKCDVTNSQSVFLKRLNIFGPKEATTNMHKIPPRLLQNIRFLYRSVRDTREFPSCF